MREEFFKMKCLIQSSSGFSLLEGMLSTGIFALSMMAVANATFFVSKSENSIETQSSLHDLHSLILKNLSQQETSVVGVVRSCSQMIQPASGSFGVNGNTAPAIPPQVNIADAQLSSNSLLIRSGQIRDKMRYILQIENWRFQRLFPAGEKRNQPTNQFLAELTLRGDRNSGNANPNRYQEFSTGNQIIISQIPILMEFNTTDNTIASCTIRPEVKMAFLQGAFHSTADCRNQDGEVFRIPNPDGSTASICHIPNMNYPANGSCPGGWNTYQNWTSTPGIGFSNTAKPQPWIAIGCI